MRSDDLYALLGVPRDASSADIRWAYERALNRAHRDGALRHAVALTQAYDALCDPRRREVYDRHGLTPVRERSPGAAPQPTPWWIAKRQPATARPARRPLWRLSGISVFTLGMIAGLLLAAYLVRG